jgi:hypothetical protein
MRPSLIPHTFITRNIRKKYHKKRAERTWSQYGVEYSSYGWLLSGFLFIIFILYLKYTEKNKQKETADNNNLNRLAGMISDEPPQPNGFLYYT